MNSPNPGPGTSVPPPLPLCAAVSIVTSASPSGTVIDTPPGNSADGFSVWNVSYSSVASIGSMTVCPPSRSSEKPSIVNLPVLTSITNQPEGWVADAPATEMPIATLIGVLPLPPNSPGIVRVPPGFVAGSWLPIQNPCESTPIDVVNCTLPAGASRTNTKRCGWPSTGTAMHTAANDPHRITFIAGTPSTLSASRHPRVYQKSTPDRWSDNQFTRSPSARNSPPGSSPCAPKRRPAPRAPAPAFPPTAPPP